MHVIATAGHVDHGKSMLVRALTGMEPDRWEEEQRRGMTIDLGFAWMALPAGEQIAFVDVPGHERFVTNMLAGAGPTPAVMFVVAADEGWKPQSAEHLAAIDALGVRDGDPGGHAGRPGRPRAGPAAGGGQDRRDQPRRGRRPGGRRGQRAHRPGHARAGRRARQARGAASAARSSQRRPAVAGPRVRHQGQRDRRHRHPAGRHRAGRGRADGDTHVAAAADPGRAVARLAGWPGQRRGEGGAEPAGHRHRRPRPRHGADHRRPLDGYQPDRCPPDTASGAPARRRHAAAARAHAAHRRSADRDPGAAAGQPHRAAQPGPGAAAARG